METKIHLKVQGLTNSQIQSGAYALILAEDGPRRLPVIVGVAEAQSIAIALEGLQPMRPLTHDLFTRFIRTFRIHLREVFIYKFEEGVYFSEMIFSDGEREQRIDSRTSDAVAVALRMGCEIYTSESIMQKCGIVMKETAESDGEMVLQGIMAAGKEAGDRGKLTNWLRIMQKNEIRERMEQAVREENYEFAKLCREELQRRETEGDTQF
ncbi:MAG: bifunctional nuclease family protein [Tannerella sp.]|nr:bifunctional nuclease family protein [Tannerella sp.]